MLFGSESRSRRCGRRRRKSQHFDRLAGRGRVLRELPALQVLESFHVAAQAETAKSAKTALAVERWQARHLNRERLVGPVDWPSRLYAAEGFVAGQRGCDLSGWIERQRLGDLGPAAAEHGDRLRVEQINEFLTCQREARLGVGLPDETEWTRMNGRQFDRTGYFRKICNRIHPRAGTRGTCRFGEDHEQCKGRARAEPNHRDMTGLDLAFRNVVQAGFSRELFGAERDEIALVPHPLDRRRLCGNGLTICGEDCRGRAEIAQQSCCPIRKGKRLSGAFSGCDQDRGAVVGERNTRAQTDEGCANARPTAAQSLKPRSAAMRECAR